MRKCVQIYWVCFPHARLDFADFAIVCKETVTDRQELMTENPCEFNPLGKCLREMRLAEGMRNKLCLKIRVEKMHLR